MKLKIFPLATKNAIFERFLTLYKASFPLAERRPENKLTGMMADNTLPMSVNAITSDGEFVGLITFWDFEDFIYIEHFATLPHLRGTGLGSETIRLMASEHAKPLVLEIEMPESSPIASRRMEFYRRNGFKPIWDFEYTQPPYSPELPSLRLLLMSTGDVDPAKVSRTLHKEVYGVED